MALARGMNKQREQNNETIIHRLLGHDIKSRFLGFVPSSRIGALRALVPVLALRLADLYKIPIYCA